MAVAKLKISKSGVSGILVLRWFKDHTWHLESPVSWFPATSGKWAQVRNATKFRQFSFLRITDEEGQSIAHFREPPYIILQKFTANLTSRSSGDPFDVEVVCSFLLDPMCSSARRPSIGDDAKIANNNFADSPDRGDPHWVKLLGATIFEVKTPQNAVLVGQNKCIDDGAIGVYGQSDGTTGGICVTGACDQGCGVAGIATSATADLPPASSGVYGRGDFHGVYGVERYLRGSKPDLSVVAPTHSTPQPDVAVVGADEDSSAAQAPAIPGLKETSAKPLRKPIGKSIWMPVAILFLVLVVVAYAARNGATAVAGLSVGQLISIELILCLSGVALYLNRRLWPFITLNSWSGSLSTGFKSWLEPHLNRRQPRFFEFAGQFSWRARVIISRKRQ